MSLIFCALFFTLSLCSMNSAKFSSVWVTSAISWDVRANSMLRMSSSCWSSLSSDQQDRKAALNRSLMHRKGRKKKIDHSWVNIKVCLFYRKRNQWKCLLMGSWMNAILQLGLDSNSLWLLLKSIYGKVFSHCGLSQLLKIKQPRHEKKNSYEVEEVEVKK